MKARMPVGMGAIAEGYVKASTAFSVRSSSVPALQVSTSEAACRDNLTPEKNTPNRNPGDYGQEAHQGVQDDERTSREST